VENEFMPTQYPPLEPLRTSYHLQFLTDEQLDSLQKATLEILEKTGVRFPSQKALTIFAEHGAQVDWQTQIVRLQPDFVIKALSTVPRFFLMGARNPAYDLQLEKGVTYFTTDGCGVETIDFDTRERRPSCKADVGTMARVSDYLPSIGFIWPMVSAQDHGETAPLHEIEAAWNNSVKHVQSETVMGEIPCRYAVEMSNVISGSREEMRRRPPFSLVVCTIAPLVQDTAGIEGALLLAEAGLPVGFLAMPTLGTTAPATLAGALAMGDAEIISATVLMQLHAPGAPVFHSLMQAWADPRTGGYVSYSLDSRTRYAPVEMAHHWGMASLGACYGTDAHEPGTWQGAGEVALDPFLAGLVGADIVTGMGLSETYTLLYPEQIIMDDDLYQRARYQLMSLDVNEETLALDTVHAVGPGGHYLGQRHTRNHIRESLVRSITHQIGEDGKYRDPRVVAIDKVDWIRKNHQPDPLETEKQAELKRILAAADKEIRKE
jgi:trimethylamine---corrinoid protein Co-methyltransferase